MRTSLICELCKKTFYPLGGHLKQKFCGRKCGYKGKKNGGTRGYKYPHLQRARIGNCLVCKKKFRATKDYKERKQKYCSSQCFWLIWKKEIRPRMSNKGRLSGEDNSAWKGDDVKYDALHRWVARHLGIPMKCDHCGKENKKKYEWANIDHEYRRNKEDWIRLCTSCHRKYDYSRM